MSTERNQIPAAVPQGAVRGAQSQPGAFWYAAVQIMARVEAERLRLGEKAERMEHES